MKWNELYENNKSRKLREISIVKNDTILKAKLGNFTNRYTKIIWIILSIVFTLVIWSFRTNINALLLSLLMLIFILVFTIYLNTYTITCKNNKMIVKTNNQKVEIEYPNLKNIYIEKSKNRIFIKKRASFFIVILYKAPNRNISNIELPVLFLNQEQVQKFLNCFELKEEKNNNIIKAKKYQLKRWLIKMIAFIIILTIIIITIILKH